MSNGNHNSVYEWKKFFLGSREHKLYTFVRSRGYMCLVTVANKYIKAFFRYPVIGVSKIVTGESPGTIEYIRLGSRLEHCLKSN